MKILIVDDDKNLRKVLSNELAAEGFDVTEAESGEKGLDLLNEESFDVILLDLNMPGLSGMEILKIIKEKEIPSETVILTAFATVSTAIEAMRLGAYDYITKPFPLERLALSIEKAYEKKRLRLEVSTLKSYVKKQFESRTILTRNPAMLEILESVRKIALSSFPLLIQGESGVGKELIARAVHDSSGRKDRDFIAINCSAIPETMLESELFGFDKGAFTGADSRKLGLLEIANKGTLFLDEIGELPLQLQGKLLRVVETGRFFRIGGTKEIAVDVRFLSATNKDLKAEVARGGFRSDLYYRINALNITIPPLRQRPEDIPLLVEFMIEKEPAFRKKRFSGDALKILAGYSWPGNVRELQNVVHRTLLLSANELIHPFDLPSDLLDTASAPSGQSRKLKDVERDHILSVLREVHGQKGRAAEILGLDPKTLYRKLKEFGY
ncbi:MAG: sigma-54 dependent transcriptional regulator [Thermodesulfovibrionales bacterium]